MLKYICLLSCIASLLFCGDHEFSQNSRNRHESLAEYFKQHTEDTIPKNWWKRDYVLGDAGGRRHKLAIKGITIDSSFVINLLDNPVGGKHQGFAYDGSYGLSINIDYTKHGLTGFNIFSSMCWRTGTNLSKKIDNQFTVSQIWGSEIVRLCELYALETLFDKRFVMKAGRLCAGNDFLSSPLYWQYVNNGFDGNPVSIFFNIPFTAYPNATWGAYLEGKPWKRLSAKFGVYNANSKIQKNKYHGVNFTFASTNGVVWITEWCALINQEKEDHGMPGNYKMGFYYLTGSRNKFSGGSEKGDPGLYFLFDQMLYRQGEPGSDQGLTSFVSVILQPKNRNLFPFFINGGLLYKGLIPGRPKDTASFGFIYGKYSSDLAHAEEKNGLHGQSAEAVLEFNYWIQLNPWFYITPDVQYIIRPKGMNTPNALVVGAQIGISNW